MLGGALVIVALFVLVGAGLTQGRAWLAEHALFIGVPLLAGGLLLCLRRRVLLERQSRLAVSGWSLLFPLTRNEHRLSSAHEVVLARDLREAADTEYEVFPVTLQGPGGETIRLRELRDHDKPRRLAEEVAKFLGLGMRDRTRAEVVVRAAGTLDLSLRQRAKLAGLRPALPARPARARSTASVAGAEATIDIPFYMHWVWSVAAGLAIAALTAVFMELDLKRDEAPELARAGLVFAVFAVGVVPAFLVLMARQGVHYRDRLVVSAHELVLTRRGLLGTRVTRLPAQEIEEVVTEPGSVTSRVVIRSDPGSVKLAAVRSDEEANWLRALLVYALTAG